MTLESSWRFGEKRFARDISTKPLAVTLNPPKKFKSIPRNLEVENDF